MSQHQHIEMYKGVLIGRFGRYWCPARHMTWAPTHPYRRWQLEAIRESGLAGQGHFGHSSKTLMLDAVDRAIRAHGPPPAPPKGIKRERVKP